MINLVSTIAGSALVLFLLLDKIEVDPRALARPVNSSKLKTGDLLLFSESAAVRALQMACVSHAAVVVCNRRGVPFVFEIRPENERPSLLPLADLPPETTLYTRRLSRALPLSQVVEYVRLTRGNAYAHTYLHAAFNLPLDSTRPFCSSLVTGLYLFCGVLTHEAATFLPRDLLRGRLPTSRGFTFSAMSLVRRRP